MRIHVTERGMFKRCRRRWKYRNKWCLVPRDRFQGPLWFGDGIHQVLASYYRKFTGEDGPIHNVPSRHWKWWISQQPGEVDSDTVELGVSMMDGYYQKINDGYDDGWDILEVESRYEWRPPGTIHTLVANIDLLVADKSGRVWIVDHKTYRDFASQTDLEQDDQMTAYITILRENDVPVVGAIYNMLRKKTPAEPRVLQSGALSKDKSIDTTAEIYRAKIAELGLDEDDYQDILLQLENNEFFKRETVLRSEGAIRNFRKYIVGELRDIGSKNTVCYPNFTRDCSWDCGYRSLCITESDYGDVQFAIDQMYDREDPRR